MLSRRRTHAPRLLVVLAVLIAQSILASGSAARPLAPKPVPVNTSLPALTGTPRVGSTLWTSTGTWTSGTPITYSYAWQRCSGNRCRAITGATGSGYSLSAADEGSTIRSVVTARNSAGSASATAAVTATVAPPPPPAGLTVAKSGPGAAETLVKSQVADSTSQTGFRDDGRILCGATCSNPDSAAGRLLAEPSEFARWSGWSGSCSGLLLTCSFGGGIVSATAQLAADGRTPSTCDGVSGTGFGALTGTTQVGYRVHWQSDTRLAYDAFRDTSFPVLMVDRDGSCGLGSAREKLFLTAADAFANTNPVFRHHQPGIQVAPDSSGWGWSGSGEFAFSPDRTRIAYSLGGVIHVADATTGLNDEMLGYENSSNTVRMQGDGPPSWSPDGSRIAFRGVEIVNNVANSYKDMLIVYPGQGSRRSSIDIYGTVCSVWKTGSELYARPILHPVTRELNSQLGAVDDAGNVTVFGRKGMDLSCPSSRAAGLISFGTTSPPFYLLVTDGENGSTVGSFQSDSRRDGKLSPDGSKVAWVELDPSRSGFELVVANSGGGPRSRIFPVETYEWSPSSDALAVVSSRTGSRQVEVVQPVTQPQSLLERWAPELRFDAQEVYRADSAASITDSFGFGATNRLLDAAGGSIAAADPADPSDALSLDYLGPTYPGNLPALDSDYLDEVDGSRDADAQRLHAEVAYGNTVYGRELPVAGGTLLQYWFFYYNNPKTFAEILELGEHEGDWEMIQIRLDGTGTPVRATFAQHKVGEGCSWDAVQTTTNGRPVVFVAHESHASYFAAGDHRVDGDYGTWGTDYADAGGGAVVPRIVDVTTPPAWMQWPGRFGGTSGPSATSPKSPYHQSKWTVEEALAFESSAAACTATAPGSAGPSARSAPRKAPAAPVLTARREGENVVIDYELPSSGSTPWLLVTTVDGDAHTPTSERTVLDGARRGRVVQPIHLSRGQLRVLASVRSRDGSRSRVVTVSVE